MKKNYIQPKAEILFVNVEGALLAGSDTSITEQEGTGQFSKDNDSYDEDDNVVSKY